MATRAMIYVKVNEEDIGKEMKADLDKVKDKLSSRLTLGAIDNQIGSVKLGKYVGIYHHWDGYPSGVGETLLNEYNDYESALNLVLLGDESTINESLHPYMGNNGEEWEHCKPMVIDSDGIGDTLENFDYLFSDGSWKFRAKGDEWKELTEGDVKE